MLLKHMDFNPLDILAAAALGEKDDSSDVKSNTGGQEPPSGIEKSEESEETKDAKESEPNMGKTTSNSLKSDINLKKEESVMAPQKAPWSPDVFLSSNLGIPNVKDSFSIRDLMNDFNKSTDCEKKSSLISEPSLTDSLIKKNAFELFQNSTNNNIVIVKNSANLALDDLLPKSPLLELLPPDDKHLDNDCISRPPEVPTDNSEQGSPSDTDTADTDSKSSEQGDYPVHDPISLDHQYALLPGQTSSSFLDPFEDDDVDVCSQNSPLIEELDQRSRNLSVDCNYLKSGILEGASASPLDLYKISSSGIGRATILSSSSSASSPSHDISSKHGLPNGIKDDMLHSPTRAVTPTREDSLSSPEKGSPKFGKFRIGTFASFSSGNLELEKYLRNKDHNSNNVRKSSGIPSDTSCVNSSLGSPTNHTSPYPLIQSPSLEWDRSEVGSETHDDSSDARTPLRLSPDITTEKITEWSHPLYHDHDYCVRDSDSSSRPEESSKPTSGKRKYTKRKTKDSVINHEKIMKAKYLKKELLKQDTFKKASPSDVDFSPVDIQLVKTNPVGRPKKRPFEKTEEEEIDPSSGTKMKITGKFQDDYVYSLPKSSRTTSRRRQAPSLTFLSDKIIIPAPKPGDIIVPHLTDADLEAVRIKGRAALNPVDKLSTSSSALGAQIPPSSSNESISDVDSHIVSTILSMENDIASPTGSQPDVPSTSELNPNQPALTESLRLMSGDNSITSEHVLNYLLSVVKDEEHGGSLVEGDEEFNTNNPTLFPSTDSVSSKADHFESQNSSVISDGNQSPLLNSTEKSVCDMATKSSPHSEATLDDSHVKKDDNVNLPEDITSLITDSQETPNSSHNDESQSSLKGMFGSDLNSIPTPSLPPSIPRLTSIEKTLDYLGVKDDLQMDHTEVLNSKLHGDMPNQLDAQLSSDDTPWIVTVTLYMNDIPAIIINNQPFIRLVDIHKQILPAKDTGILKKRCQLLKIPVLNCSEMQRYFLVQYGRAYNSKSTLIISKEQATDLVTYYATPQPRVGRSEETGFYRSHSRGSDSGGTMSPVTVPTSGASGKRSYNKGPKKTNHGHAEEIPQDKASHNTGTRNKRTRHKKVNYLEMLRGEEKDAKSSEDSIMETIEAVVRSSPGYCEHLKTKKKSSKSSDNFSKKKVKGGDKKIKKSKSEKISKLKEKKIKQGSKGKTQQNSEKIKNKTKNPSKVNKSHHKLNGVNSDLDSEDDLDMSRSKFKPLKLKMNSLFKSAGNKKDCSPGVSPPKKGLFSRSNSSSSSERHVRVLAVAHQSAVVNEKQESHLPSQPADIHLDLFTRSSSPCVRCQTCCQFLSVPDFMRHHHVAMDNEWLATEAADRILVPRNKENISESEKKLWEEFHRLQEAIGGFGEGDDDDDETESDNDQYGDEDDQCLLDITGTSSPLLDRSPSSVGSSRISQQAEQSSSSEDESDDVDGSYNKQAYSRAEKLKHEMASRCGLVKRDMCRTNGASSLSLNSYRSISALANSRTSSRKRKSKQLFSIENYQTPKKTGIAEELTNLAGSKCVK